MSSFWDEVERIRLDVDACGDHWQLSSSAIAKKADLLGNLPGTSLRYKSWRSVKISQVENVQPLARSETYITATRADTQRAYRLVYSDG